MLDPLQFALPKNRPINDAIMLAIYTVLTHLNKGNTYIRILFTDYSSAFITIIALKLFPNIRGVKVVRVSNFKFLDMNTTRGLSWNLYRHCGQKGMSLFKLSKEAQEVWYEPPIFPQPSPGARSRAC